MPTRIHVTTESLEPSAQRWDSVYTTFKATSSLFTSSSSIQTLEFDEITNGLTILGGNTVSLSSLANVGTGVDTEVRSLTAQWSSTYTTVKESSAVIWNYQGTDLKDLSANWQETYTTFKNASSTFLTSETDSQILNFDEINKELTITNGNTVSLSSFGTGADVEVRALTANWEETYTTFKNASSTFLTSETDSQTLSFDEITKELSILNGNTVSLSSFGTGADVELRALSANWQETYTTFKNASSTFLTSETDSQILNFDEITKDLTISSGNVVSLSALVDGTAVDVGVRALTGDYTSVFNTVQSNSATNWSYEGTDLKDLSANWQNTFTTVTDNSAKWETTYTTFNENSAIYVKTVATTTPGTSAITTIVAVSALPVSPDFNTLYIVI